MENTVNKQIVVKERKHCKMVIVKHVVTSRKQIQQGNNVNGQSVKTLKEITCMQTQNVHRARRIPNQHQQLLNINSLK